MYQHYVSNSLIHIVDSFVSVDKGFDFRCPSFSLLNSKESATVIINLELIGTNFIKFQMPEEGFSIASKGKIIVPDNLQKEIQEFDKEADEMFSYTEVSIEPSVALPKFLSMTVISLSFPVQRYHSSK